MTRPGLPPCTNDSRAAVVACGKCTFSLCDDCAVHLVNGRVWCASCATAQERAARPTYGLGALVLGVGFAVVGGLLVLEATFAGQVQLVTLYAGVPATLALAARVTWGSPGGDAPRFERRRPGEPLPL